MKVILFFVMSLLLLVFVPNWSEAQTVQQQAAIAQLQNEINYYQSKYTYYANIGDYASANICYGRAMNAMGRLNMLRQQIAVQQAQIGHPSFGTSYGGGCRICAGKAYPQNRCSKFVEGNGFYCAKCGCHRTFHTL